MISRLFQAILNFFASLWNAFIDIVQQVLGWLWAQLQSLFGWISQALTNWTSELLTYILNHLPGVTVDQSVISTIREHFVQWNNIIPISDLIACVGIYMGAYLIMLSIRFCIFVYDKASAVVP